MQIQRMHSVPILYINANVSTDTMLKFDANADANVDIDAQCERTFRESLAATLCISTTVSKGLFTPVIYKV